ncbi:MAG TPA: VWA domain-containing protein [Vicinamibacterales bacterium]|jgi:Ca-activated chloride channel family protein|nr:VWA domain-containing protein [Vicinamibacterales bacterium]
MTGFGCSCLTILTAWTALAVTAGAQGPIIQQRKPLRSTVELTVVTATVRNADGQLVPGLPKEDFEVYEDGVQQPIAQFTNERVPIGLGLLLDISDSMFGRRLQDARSAVERFLLELLAPTDEFFLMAFNHEPRQLTGWTAEPGRVRNALEQLRPTGATAIYDAVKAALPTIAMRSRERAALVIISDGADTASDTSLYDLRTDLLRTDAFIFAIAIDSPKEQPINTRVNPEALAEVTNQTGGHTDVVRDSADLDVATQKIADELNSQYVIGYASPHPGDGKYHSIRVRVTLPGYRVRARNGYVAVGS